MFFRHCLSVAILGLVLPAFADETGCDRPDAPTSLPDGATAGEDAMIEASRIVKQFVADGEAYTTCLQPQIDEAKTVVEDAEGTDRHEAASILLVKLISLHDSMVDEMKATATAFNMSVKAYNAR